MIFPPLSAPVWQRGMDSAPKGCCWFDSVGHLLIRRVIDMLVWGVRIILVVKADFFCCLMLDDCCLYKGVRAGFCI